MPSFALRPSVVAHWLTAARKGGDKERHRGGVESTRSRPKANNVGFNSCGIYDAVDSDVNQVAVLAIIQGERGSFQVPFRCTGRPVTGVLVSLPARRRKRTLNKFRDFLAADERKDANERYVYSYRLLIWSPADGQRSSSRSRSLAEQRATSTVPQSPSAESRPRVSRSVAWNEYCMAS